jgi:hypothetical protein
MPAVQLTNIKMVFPIFHPSKSVDFKIFNFVFQLNIDYGTFTYSYILVQSLNCFLSLVTSAVCI